MEENIKRWQPIAEIPSKLYVKELVHKDGLTILLANDLNENEIISIYFKYPYGYRNLDESYHLRTIDEVPFLMQNWSLFKSTAGDFIESFNQLSYDVYKDKLINYMIVTSNDVIEILAHEAAEVIVTKVSD